MTEEENIQQKLTGKFAFLENKVRVQRPRRIFIEVSYDNFRAVFEYAVGQLGFSVLCTITGLDEVQNMGAIYHLAQPGGITLNIKTSIPKDKPVLDTITKIFPNADIYEREIEDLFGININGLEPGKRYPLPDDWPKGDHPLRKDWKSVDPKK